MEGKWLDTATSQNMPSGALEWKGIPRKAYSGMVGNRVVATVRHAAIGRQTLWMARLKGWQWVIPEGNYVTGAKDSPVKGFKTSQEAKAAIDRAFALRPTEINLPSLPNEGR